ncbi:MAG: response regulator [Nitrospirae bacterium]|nr:MAG: response regulator [Nitrospirota bacterium]
MGDENTKILLVDDDGFVREMLGMILEAHGYEVVTAEDGTEALSKLAGDNGFKLVVSDMNMPKTNGLELVREVRKNGNTVPIIILSAFGERDILDEAMTCGATDYVVKDEKIQDKIIEVITKALKQAVT